MTAMETVTLCVHSLNLKKDGTKIPASLKSGSSRKVTAPANVIFVVASKSEEVLSNLKALGFVSEPVNFIVYRSGGSTSTLAARLSFSPFLKLYDC